MIIHLVRHTTPEVEPGLCYGQTDLELAASFKYESEQVLRKLSNSYDAVYTSPLQRCSRLAAKINTQQRITDERIMEYDFGDWELKPWADFKSADALAWMDDFVDMPAPKGDSMHTMKARVDEFYFELIALDYERVAVVTHSGVQRLLHGLILTTPMSHLFRLQLDFGAVLEIQSYRDSGLQTIKHL